jgi:hypothetical protein
MRLTPAPASYATLRGCYATDSGFAARAQARFAINARQLRRSLASPTAAAEPYRKALDGRGIGNFCRITTSGKARIITVYEDKPN